MLHPNCLKVQTVLSDFGLSATVQELPESTRTAEEAANAIGTKVAQIGKSLLFQAGGSPLLVIASGINRVCLSKLSSLLEKEISQPSGKEVKELTGFPIGGVPPVGHATKMSVIIDKDLLQYSRIWLAAGTPRSIFSCTPDELVKITTGCVWDIAE